jgi:hypothetical protein
VKKLFFISLFLFLILPFSWAQSSKLTLKANQVNIFYQEITQATLIIPITNAKDPEEKALLDAVKNYWKICPYKTISRKDFDELQTKHEAPSPKTFYLVKETYERLKQRKKDWAYTKYYISKQNHWVEEQDEPFIEFKLPLKTVNRVPTELPVAYLFGLMIKHFNNEVLLMKNEEAYANISGRKKLFKVNFKHSLKSYANKTLLVSKNELENYMINLPEDKKDVEKQLARFIKSIRKKTKIKPANIKIVNEVDIKLAIAKADANTLIYTGYTIYNTQDATMLRRIDPNKGARPFHWVLASTIVVVVVVVATIATGIL